MLSTLPQGLVQWNFTTGNGVFSSPAVANGMTYVGSHDGKVYVLDAATGLENTGPPVVKFHT